MDGLTVSQVSKLAGVSVRTLHHYDEIGLLRPSGRSGGGYRLYGQEALQRLQQVLFFKELGFPLEEIAKILKDPAFELHAALVMQRQLLEEKAVRIRALLKAVDAAIASIERGTIMTKEEMFEVFGTSIPRSTRKRQSRSGATAPRTRSRSGAPRATARRNGSSSRPRAKSSPASSWR